MHSRISDTYLLLLHPPSIRGKKRGIRGSCGVIMAGWSKLRFVVVPARNIFQDSRPRQGRRRTGMGKTKGGKIPGCKLKAKFRFLFHCSGDYRLASVSFPVYFLLRWSVYVSRDVVNLIQFTGMNVELFARQIGCRMERHVLSNGKF